MTESAVCIACLSSDIKMYSIKNTQLSVIFENLTNIKLSKLDGMSQMMCYICYSQLQKCCRFIKMSQKAGVILTQLHIDKLQITPGTVSALDERTSYVTTIEQASIPSFETDVNPSAIDEETGSNTNVGVFTIDLEDVGTLKEEPKDIDDQMTIEDDFVAIKHEPMEAIEHTTPQNCAQIKPEHDLVENRSENTTELKTENNSTETIIKYKETRIRKTKKKIHQCNICSRKFGCPAYLLRHIRTHTGEKPYSCDSCGKAFTQNGHLIQHMRLHTGEKPFECHICKNKAFNHRYNYKSHMKKHFGKPSHTCDICKSAFHQKGDLKRHMMSHTGERPYACTFCDVKFAQNCHLRKHIRIHTKEPYSCQYCTQTFNHKLDFNNHLITHKETETFPCPHEGCTKSFTKQNTLTNHIKSHKGERLYVCVKCRKTFKQKGHLTRHTIIVHDKEQCDLKQEQNNLQLSKDTLKQDELDQDQNHVQEYIEEYIIP